MGWHLGFSGGSGGCVGLLVGVKFGDCDNIRAIAMSCGEIVVMEQ